MSEESDNLEYIEETKENKKEKHIVNETIQDIKNIKNDILLIKDLNDLKLEDKISVYEKETKKIKEQITNENFKHNVIYSIILIFSIIVASKASYHDKKIETNSYIINREINFVKYPNVTKFEDVTEKELKDGYIGDIYLEEIFGMMKNFLKKNNKTCVSFDYFDHKSNNKKIIGFLINNRKDFVNMINPKIIGQEEKKLKIISKDFCKENSTSTFDLHHSITIKYTHQKQYTKNFFYISSKKETKILENIIHIDGKESYCLEITIKKINGFIFC